MPALLILVLAIVQGCLWWFARQAVITAAREGVEAGRVQTGTGPAAERARETATNLGGNLLQGVNVTTPGTTPERIRVQVSARSLSIVPGLPGISITQHAEAAREKWVAYPG
jgi:hypothetical protein